MVGDLLLRGMLAGIVAGLLAFAFASVFGEPMVDKAIGFEEQVGHEHSHSHSATETAGEEEPELVSRATQSTFGLLTAVTVYGMGLGGLFALVFAFAYGRSGRLRPRSLAALLAGAAFVVLFLVPYLKYPANPPAVGNPDTIEYRTAVYFLMVLFSAAAFAMVACFNRHLANRLGTWNGALVAAAAFIVIIAVAQALLPNINEVPENFPAVVLWRFRIASLGIQLVLWATVGLLFGALAERYVEKRHGTAKVSFAHQS